MWLYSLVCVGNPECLFFSYRNLVIFSSCVTPYEDPCWSNPCMNHGHCEASDMMCGGVVRWQCTCPYGYHGDMCQYKGRSKLWLLYFGCSFCLTIKIPGKTAWSLALFYCLSCFMRKTEFCLCENKGPDQLCSNCTADQCFCFSLHG